MNPISDIFNYQYVQKQAAQQHENQVYEIQKCAKALKDFLDGTARIAPEYSQIANAEFCAVIARYLGKHLK